MPHVRSVSAGIWIGSGARRETDRQTGISHFIEHMVFKGTERRSAEQIARSVDSIGGNLDAFTAKELVAFSVKVLDEHLPLAFELLADLVLRPLFREQDIIREKSVVLEEIKMETDSPEYLVHQLFCDRFWANHPLGRPILGTRKTIERFHRTMIQQYFRDVYTPSNILVAAAGNLHHEALLELVSKEFAGLRDGKRPPAQEPAYPQPHLLLKNKKALEQVQVCLGVPAYPVTDPRRHGCYLLNTILGGGMSSRLFQKIREDRGLAYEVLSELNLYRDTGCLLVTAGTSRASLREVVRLTLEEFSRLKEQPVTAEELRRAKNQLKGSLMLSLESTASRMANLARQQLYFGRVFELDEVLTSIEEVTADQVQAIARDLFEPEKVALTVLGALDGLRISRAELAC